MSPTKPRRRGGAPRLLRSLVIVTPPKLAPDRPPISFAPADQQRRLCPICERAFTTSSTLQTWCSFACASGGRADD